MIPPPGNGIALHVCCAPCLAGALASLREGQGGAPAGVGTIVFYNPNIHPLLEFRRRLKAVRIYLERDPLPAEIDEEYGLETFLAAVLDGGRQPRDRRERCRRCYLLRFGRVAEMAAAAGYAAFSSTLLASREQDRDLVAEAGREAAGRRGLEFVTADFRRTPPPEKLLRGVYRQQYCGCVFSEEERHRPTSKHLYRGAGGPPE